MIYKRNCCQHIDEENDKQSGKMAEQMDENEGEKQSTKDIANIVKGMDPSDFSGPMNQLSEMASVCSDMFIKVMEAYNDRDENLARVCANEDHDVDDLNHLAASSLLMQLVSQPDVHMHATHLLWIAYHLERIGDLIKNIAERVVFMITAKTPDLD